MAEISVAKHKRCWNFLQDKPRYLM